MSIWGPGGRETLVSCISWVRARLSLGLERNKSPSCLCGVTRLQCVHEILIGRKEVDASSSRPYCVWRLFFGLENGGPGGWVLEVLGGTEPAAAIFRGPLSRYLVSRVEQR